MTRRQRGFTLIELLVVIAIIAILAAILFPVFAQARAKARQAACMSNLKQLGLGITMYAQDHSEMLPVWGYGDTSDPDNGPAQGFFSWDTVIDPYLKNKQILKCPNNPYGSDYRGYAMTRYTGDVYGVNLPMHMDLPPLPAETVLLCDKGKKPVGANGDAAMEAFYQSHGATGYDLETDMFHSGGKNFLYLDGHVKWHGENSGPFAAVNTGVTCPPANLPSGWDSDAQPYEEHGPGHCEFHTDWPRG
ncbi:MAG: DUF1559 domain-containing protein [Armatimonadota bacterium]|jgi:prepilin-type N-terminal cleavage/methylation domain-containing protein/prepilin-type processing-associated H-X9-DG protein